MKNKKKETIAAVVVTYNRKELLKECLNALLNQTRRPESIIIMDNASTDGTQEMLKKEFLKKKIFDYVKLKTNTGGAGGFHYGMKRAYEKGFDWIWVMDDDAILDRKALFELTRYNERNSVTNSIVLDNKCPSKLSWGLVDHKNKKIYYRLEELDKQSECLNDITLFLGTLFSRRVINKIGFPDKDFFIWGDDREYYIRISKSKLKMKTVISSKIYHPAIYINRVKTIMGEAMIHIPVWKYYYFVRNTFFIYKKHNKKKLMFIPLIVIKNSIIIVFYEADKRNYFEALFYGLYHFFINRYGKFNRF